ncbi:MAG TPA: hypothetical protein VGW34_12340 [Allosphingosinicella sp.]|nr:hypothetical protein [Allosphingosinicella sp.]
MERRLTLAALMMPLAFATPAMAQVAGVSDNGSIAPLPAPFPDPGYAFRAPVREQLSRPPRNILVGSWPLSENVQLGVGLYSVVRTSPKERELSRLRPMRDTGGRNSRVAAIGISFRF